MDIVQYYYQKKKQFHHCKTIILLHVLRYSNQSKSPLFIKFLPFFINGDKLPLINPKKFTQNTKIAFYYFISF